ncbi:hypothetical protein [Corallococcus sp. CA041A]|uniref:hypothetical protein n=1 Tax=Corallococcus sp. CA041A TaxID=2316727 RepID=UPI0011C468BD|nr:hypothetical protein [Corallococcus sp. CA041A]
MAYRPICAEYAKRLATLEGDDFQLEVCTLLSRNFFGFQFIPDKPSGDGGLDGLSHNHTVGYCCYGPEIAGAGLTSADIKTKVLSKFYSDLRRIFELDFPPSAKKNATPIHSENKKLSSIVRPGSKLTQVTLCCSWFEDNTIIGPLNAKFDEYKKISKLNYIDPACTLTFQGPHQISTSYAVDDQAMLRLEQPDLMKALNKTPIASTQPPPDLSAFEEKMQVLADTFPQKKNSINSIRKRLLEDWGKSLQVSESLNNTAPNIYKKYENLIKDVANKALEQSMTAGPSDFNTILSKFREGIALRLKDELHFPPEEIQNIAAQLTAQLVGECPIDWRP